MSVRRSAHWQLTIAHVGGVQSIMGWCDRRVQLIFVCESRRRFLLQRYIRRRCHKKGARFDSAQQIREITSGMHACCALWCCCRCARALAPFGRAVDVDAMRPVQIFVVATRVAIILVASEVWFVLWYIYRSRRSQEGGSSSVVWCKTCKWKDTVASRTPLSCAATPSSCLALLGINTARDEKKVDRDRYPEPL